MTLLPTPALGWLAIFVLISFTLLCVVAGIGNLIRLAFPLGCFLVGIFLYRRYSILYLGFTWWLWILTPWVRRLIDYQSGWVNPSPVLLAPYLVTLITLAAFFRHLPQMYRQDYLPYVLSSAGIVYGMLIGLVNTKFGASTDILFLHSVLAGAAESKGFTYTATGVIIHTLDWITPIPFGFYLLVNWQHYPEYRQNFQRVFCWGVIVAGGYGIVQYLIAPAWDKFWLQNVIAIGNSSFGTPEPLGIRVFSTMNAPGPFATFMMAGLLLLLTTKGSLAFIAVIAGYIPFLLSLARIMWGAWFVGLLVLGTSIKQSTQMRLIITLVLIAMIAAPLMTIEPFSEVIGDRLETLTSVQQDGSFQARSEIYQKALGVALSTVIGHGFGTPRMDSAFIDMFVAMGWVGVVPYAGGITLLVVGLFQSAKTRSDVFIHTATAISFGILVTIGIGNPLIEVSGLLMWSFQSIALAGQKYYKRELQMAQIAEAQ
jgi:hypothetical protein